MSNQASLFELCSEVYERTGWEGVETYAVQNDDDDEPFLVNNDNTNLGHNIYRVAYLYTSDCLLEKLPRYLRLQRDDMDYPQKFAFKLRASTKDTNNWRAGYYNTPKKQVFQNLSIDCHGDTPLKALLKLTIALSEAGELK